MCVLQTMAILTYVLLTKYRVYMQMIQTRHGSAVDKCLWAQIRCPVGSLNPNVRHFIVESDGLLSIRLSTVIRVERFQVPLIQNIIKQICFLYRQMNWDLMDTKFQVLLHFFKSQTIEGLGKR